MDATEGLAESPPAPSAIRTAWDSIPHRKWVVTAVVAVIVLLVGVVWPLSSYNGVRNHLIDAETGLNAQYQANQAELDAFIKTVHEQFDVAGAKAGKLDQVLTDAVRGLYDKTSLPGAPQPVQSGQQTPLISALVQAYPNLGGLDVYDRVVDTIASGRQSFKKVQVKLLDMIRPYDAYRTKGIFHQLMVHIVGYPKLEARIGRTVLTGKAALDQMKLIVTSTETSHDFTSGNEAPINFGK